MKEHNNKTVIIVNCVISAIFLFGIALAVTMMQSYIIKDTAPGLKNILYPCALCLIMVIYMITEYQNLLTQLKKVLFVLFCFLLSGMLVLLIPEYLYDVPIWLIGGCLIAAMIDRNLGLLVCYCYIYLAVMSSGVYSVNLLIHFIFGTACCILLPHMKKLITALYGAVLISSTILIFYLILSLFTKQDAMPLQILFCTITYVALVLISYFIRNWLSPVLYETAQTDDTISDNFLELVAMHADEAEARLPSYSAYLDENAELLLKLKEKDEKTYKVSMYSGLLAKRIAHTMGFQEDLAQAGGYYSKIGKILPGSYILNGIAIAKENNFPDKLFHIIEEQEYRHKAASSPEGMLIAVINALFMMLDYLRSSGKTAEFIIGKTLFSCLNFGVFDHCGISMEQYGRLRKFFLEEWDADEFLNL